MDEHREREHIDQSTNMDALVQTKRWLYLDDIRVPIDPTFDLVCTYQQFTEYIEKCGIPELISFDHDLHDEHIKHYFNADGRLDAEDYERFEHKTGMDCCKFLVDYCERNRVMFDRIYIHTHNPIGRINMKSYLLNYARSKGVENPRVIVFEPPYTMPTKTPW